MLGRQDRIADYAQNVAEQLFRPLYDNDEARQMVMEMAEAVQKTVAIYEDTVLHLRDLTLSGYTKTGREELLKYVQEVNLAEHEADLVESNAAGFVFRTGGDDALAAVHMYRVLQRLDDVANACEEAAQRIPTNCFQLIHLGLVTMEELILVAVGAFLLAKR